MDFKERVFCSSDCTNQHCPKFWTDELHDVAQRWLGENPEDAFVRFQNFSKGCKEYKRDFP